MFQVDSETQIYGMQNTPIHFADLAVGDEVEVVLSSTRRFLRSPTRSGSRNTRAMKRESRAS